MAVQAALDSGDMPLPCAPVAYPYVKPKPDRLKERRNAITPGCNASSQNLARKRMMRTSGQMSTGQADNAARRMSAPIVESDQLARKAGIKGKGSNLGFAVYHSESVHMWAAATIATAEETFGGVTWSLLAGFSSLALVALQILMLAWLSYEVSHPTCFEVSGCKAGEFCHATNHRCQDCLGIYTVMHNAGITAANCTQHNGAHSLVPGGEPVTPWIDGDVYPWNNIDYTTIDLSSPTINMTDPATMLHVLCLSKLHCDETDIDNRRCDHLMMKLRSASFAQFAIVAMVALLLAVPLCKEMCVDGIPASPLCFVRVHSSTIAQGSHVRFLFSQGVCNH